MDSETRLSTNSLVAKCWLRHPSVADREEPFSFCLGTPKLKARLGYLGIATPSAIELLVSAFTGTRPDWIQMDPRALGGGPIGHFGFFRPLHRETLWGDTVDWLAGS